MSECKWFGSFSCGTSRQDERSIDGAASDTTGSVWSKRHKQIRDLEETLSAEGRTIVRIMLHISKGEQKERLQTTIDMKVSYPVTNLDLSNIEIG